MELWQAGKNWMRVEYKDNDNEYGTCVLALVGLLEPGEYIQSID